jgi:polysaccharide deacetylase family protein (PEP-CTERM system associated)
LPSHFFTVDVEEHFQVSAFEGSIPRAQWDYLESRVAGNVARLLEILAASGARATFFVLGWIAERHPAMVRAIVEAGHEVASHGYDHRRVTEQTPEEFRASVRRSKHTLEDIAGAPVLGFRAPSFSIVPGREWALDVLIEEGHRYDSSLFPVRRPGYGYAGGGREPYALARAGGELLEFPPATLRRFGWTMPAAGGAYLRILPFSLVRAAFAEAERRSVPATFYLHPWELDPAQPRLAVSRTARFRHYTGLHRTKARVERLLAEFRFTSIASCLVAYGAEPHPWH